MRIRDRLDLDIVPGGVFVINYDNIIQDLTDGFGEMPIIINLVIKPSREFVSSWSLVHLVYDQSHELPLQQLLIVFLPHEEWFH